MKAAGAILGLVIVLAVGYLVYKAELAPGPVGGAAAPEQPVEQIDTVGVTADLVSIGQAERTYLASHDTYATLDQLRQEGSITFSSRHGYSYTIEVDGGQHFKAVAAPADAAHRGQPTLSIDDTLQVARQ